MTQLDDIVMNAPGHRTTALRLLGSAAGFASLADATVAHRRQPGFLRGNNTVASYFAMAQAAELALKAFLAMHGMPEAELVKLGHDLRKVLDAARAQGLSDSRELPTHRFEILNNVYRGAKQLQYPNVDAFVLPPMRATREMVEDFIREAASKVAENNVAQYSASDAVIAAHPGPTLDQIIASNRAEHP